MRNSVRFSVHLEQLRRIFCSLTVPLTDAFLIGSSIVRFSKIIPGKFRLDYFVRLGESGSCYARIWSHIYHPNDEDLSSGAPDSYHPNDEDLSSGAPDIDHPNDEDLSSGAPDSEMWGTPLYVVA